MKFFMSIVVLLMLSTNVQADDHMKFCRDVSYLAENIMAGRQYNIRIDEAYENIMKETADEPSAIKELVKTILITAYKVPQGNNRKSRRGIAVSYRKELYLLCLGMDTGTATLPIIHTPDFNDSIDYR